MHRPINTGGILSYLQIVFVGFAICTRPCASPCFVILSSLELAQNALVLPLRFVIAAFVVLHRVACESAW